MVRSERGGVLGEADRRGESKSILGLTENLLENTDGVLRRGGEGVRGTPSVFSRDGTLLPSNYADVRYIDDVIAF